MTHPEPLTVADICARTGASSDVVLDWIHSGELVARNVAAKTGPGTRPTYRIDAADFEAFREARRVKVVGQVKRRAPRVARTTVPKYV